VSSAADGCISAAFCFHLCFVEKVVFQSIGLAANLRPSKIRELIQSCCASREIHLLLSFPQPFHKVKYMWPAQLHCHVQDSQQYFPHTHLCLPTIHTRNQETQKQAKESSCMNSTFLINIQLWTGAIFTTYRCSPPFISRNHSVSLYLRYSVGSCVISYIHVEQKR